jgi:hypothetical protein
VGEVDHSALMDLAARHSVRCAQGGADARQQFAAAKGLVR